MITKTLSSGGRARRAGKLSTGRKQGLQHRSVAKYLRTPQRVNGHAVGASPQVLAVSNKEGIDTRCSMLTIPGRNRVLPMASEVKIMRGDALALYPSWPDPIAIISDGAYGVGGFPGDPPTFHGLPEWYKPHIEAWASYATPQTTLWFWNTEIGWATVHPLLESAGWKFRNCHIWDKGIAHIAGNANSQTLRKFPVVTEVCVQYVQEARFPGPHGITLPMKAWLRREWARSGLPFHRTNVACGVKNAATRKYFTKDHLWYYPPVEMFKRLAAYANEHGAPEGRPYFSLDGKAPICGDEWARMRAKFSCEHGVTNVWNEPAMRGEERIKDHRNRCVHLNQKPVNLLDRIIRASTDPGDVVWEPFGGLCSVAIACALSDRSCYSAEQVQEYFDLATERLENELAAASAANATASGRKLASSRFIRSRARDASCASFLFQT